jgi:hypothetical protein
MYAPNDDLASQPLFTGLARPHRIRDFAAVALCLSLIGGFVAHAATPAPPAAPQRPSAAMMATTAVQPGCPDVRVQ